MATLFLPTDNLYFYPSPLSSSLRKDFLMPPPRTSNIFHILVLLTTISVAGCVFGILHRDEGIKAIGGNDWER